MIYDMMFSVCTVFLNDHLFNAIPENRYSRGSSLTRNVVPDYPLDEDRVLDSGHKAFQGRTTSKGK